MHLTYIIHPSKNQMHMRKLNKLFLAGILLGGIWALIEGFRTANQTAILFAGGSIISLLISFDLMKQLPDVEEEQ